MKAVQSSPASASAGSRRVSLWLALGFGLMLCKPDAAQANVYATNVRLNGGTNNVAIGTNGSVTINYLLNEPATAGVLISIKDKYGGATIRTFSLAGGGPGATRGSNAVVWDGKDNSSNSVGGGPFVVQIAAAAVGFGDWTQTSNDADDGSYVFAPRGIAVNRNPNSLYYGRVFVANAGTGPYGGPGDKVGILKLNADSSFAEEGAFSDGGWPWAGDGSSPWKIEVSADDFVYVDDFNTNSQGLLVRFDQTISTNSQAAVLRNDNWPNGGVRLSGPFITGQGAGTQIWMADTNSVGFGIRRWDVAAGGAVATNDHGVTIVQAGDPSNLDGAPADVAMDASNRIYTIQSVLDSGNPADRVFRFPAYTNVLETNADWLVGSGDDSMLGASGIAVDSTATYVAVSFQGSGSEGVKIFNAADGVGVTTLASGQSHDHTDVAWDNVGNLYTCNNYIGAWRVYSPPGTNQATTVAVASVRIGPTPTAPILSDPACTNGLFHCTLNGQSDVTYIIQGSTNLNDWDPVLTNTAPTAARSLSITAPQDQSYYRAIVAQ